VSTNELEEAVAALRAGLVVAAATETFFGLLADARQKKAIDRVLSLKGRDAAKGISLLLPGRDAWAGLVLEISPIAAKLADHFWPGPLTIVLPARSDLDPRLVVDGKVAARWPGASVAATLTERLGSPVTATSANLSGQPACASHDEVHRAFPHASDLLVLSGRAPGGAPSTLVEIGAERLRIVRPGAISRDQIAAVVPGAALS
jgi:L-threonylcarbamoyladenylate synthase